MDLSSFNIFDYLPENLSENEKKVALGLIVAEIILVIATLIIGFFYLISLFNQPTSKQTLVSNQASPTSTPTIQPTATETPTPTPTTNPLSDVWIIYQIYENAVIDDGTVTDVATLVNKNDQYTSIRARCIDPGLPSPSIGQTYKESEDGTLLPEPNNSTNNLQRFTKYTGELPK